jgi:hypothetical protein
MLTKKLLLLGAVGTGLMVSPAWKTQAYFQGSGCAGNYYACVDAAYDQCKDVDACIAWCLEDYCSCIGGC